MATEPTLQRESKPSPTQLASKAYAAAEAGDAAGMQREMLAHGPLSVGFFVYNSDLAQYRSGVYRRSAAAAGPVGGHAVKLIGWGVDDGKPYWLAVNSWSPRWGEGGYFRIWRGTNECGIEETPAAGLPDVVLAEA